MANNIIWSLINLHGYGYKQDGNTPEGLRLVGGNEWDAWGRDKGRAFKSGYVMAIPFRNPDASCGVAVVVSSNAICDEYQRYGLSMRWAHAMPDMETAQRAAKFLQNHIGNQYDYVTLIMGELAVKPQSDTLARRNELNRIMSDWKLPKLVQRFEPIAVTKAAPVALQVSESAKLRGWFGKWLG